MQTTSDTAGYVLRFINQTGRSVFLTGKAGTGKTTLLREILRTTHKSTVVVAPTGIAALNAGGVTIHSMFQLPFATFVPENISFEKFSDAIRVETPQTLKRHFHVASHKQAVIRNMELLVIDEVSMLRADLLDAMDFMMRSIRKNDRPFGGVQVLFIGDLMQLPPVVKTEEWHILKQYYNGIFFFQSHVIRDNPPVYIELDKIYRQNDNVFIAILDNLRNNRVTSEDIQSLNRYVNPQFDLKCNDGYITLTTHNVKADKINAESLESIDAQHHTYYPEIVGDFPERVYPVDELLRLKEGARVMFIKNDLSPEKNFFNGKTGIIRSLAKEEILVYFPEEDKVIEVERYEWKNIRYYIDDATKEIKEEILGTFVHYPLKLAWAITVHKSQGLTFNKAVLDVTQVFLPGQAYVALSRLRSLEGLVLLSPLQMNGISSDGDVISYSGNRSAAADLDHALLNETNFFIRDFLKTSFNLAVLIQEWRSHYFSYNQEAQKSPKNIHKQWAKECFEKINPLFEPSRKFMSQLDSLFNAGSVDMQHVADRVSAAINYFFPLMDHLTGEVLYKLEEAARMKKAKTFHTELLLLEELQTKSVLTLLKAKGLMAIVLEGKPLSKDNFFGEEIKNYRQYKAEEAKAAFKKANAALIEEETTSGSSPGKKAKTVKKSTVEETYELWKQHLSITEIASARKLTKQTISTHFAKLIQAKAVRISDLFSEDKIAELSIVFEGYTEESLNPLKEKHGDRFTWDELKMFRASLVS
ncbi:MAG TPA: helix-turn-helix domain-containing protein [Flavobacterium sp.]|jgi:uncharacterized protein YpbB